MAKITVFFSIVLILLGAASFILTGQKFPTSFGLLGFLGTAMSLVDAVRLLQGKIFPYPAAVEEKAAMAILMLIFVILCVCSFVAARRARACS